MDAADIILELDAKKANLSPEEFEKEVINTCRSYEKENPTDFPGQAALYNELGSFYRMNGQYPEGEKAFLKAKELLETWYEVPVITTCDTGSCPACAAQKGPVDPHEELVVISNTNTADYATVLNNLAGLYRMAGDNDRALSTFDKALEHYAALDDVPGDVYASCFNNKGLVYLRMQKGKEALELFEKALSIGEKAENSDSVMGTTFSNMAFAYIYMGDKASALSVLTKAEECFTRLGEQGESMLRSCRELEMNLKK